MSNLLPLSRRQFIERSALTGAGLLTSQLAWGATASPSANRQAQIAISLDLEMAANFPKWEDTSANYDKGNLGTELKRYALEASRRVKARGGVIHFFLVGRCLEQEDIRWLQEIIGMGHSVGNHTYDHVAMLAKTKEEIQFRFRRAPWLIEGKSISEVLRENIHLTNQAFKSRLGVLPAGFRTPGGLRNALDGREDLQRMMLDLGFTWISSKYPEHAYSKPGVPPDQGVFRNIVESHASAQPYIYPSGLVEIPMNAISDVGAFRNGRWQLDHFLHATRLSVEWAIKHRTVFDFLGHPAVLSAMDPEFKTIDLICDLVRQAGERAAIVDLGTIAAHMTRLPAVT